jgi:hypothetical protein
MQRGCMQRNMYQPEAHGTAPLFMVIGMLCSGLCYRRRFHTELRDHIIGCLTLQCYYLSPYSSQNIHLGTSNASASVPGINWLN